MKKLLISAGLCITTFALAQTTPNTQAEISSYAIKIDSLVRVEKAKMNKELDVLEKNATALSIEELKRKKEEIAKEYEQRLNQKISSQKQDLEKIIQLSVKDALIDNAKMPSTNNITILGSAQPSVVEFSTRKDNPKDRLSSHNIVQQIGFQSINANATSLDLLNNNSNIKPSLSSTSLLYIREKQVGNPSSSTFLRYGLGWTWNAYNLVKPMVYNQNNQSLFIDHFEDGIIKKTRLSTHYLEMPLEMQWVLNPKYIIQNDEKLLDMQKRQFRIGLGFYGRYRVGSNINMIYENDESRKNVFQQNTSVGLSRAIFGTTVSIGYGGLNFYIKKDLIPTFTNQAAQPDRYGLTFGITLINLKL